MKNITFDESSAHLILQIVFGKKKTPNCHACHKKVTAKNLGAVIKLESGSAVFHKNIVCLFGMISEQQKEKKNAKA